MQTFSQWLPKNIQIDMSDYEKTLRQNIQKTLDFSLENNEKIKNFIFDKNYIHNALKEMSYIDEQTKQNIIKAVDKKDPQEIFDLIFHLRRSLKLNVLSQEYEKFKTFYNYLWIYAEKLENLPEYSEKEAEENIADGIKQTYSHMLLIQKEIAAAIARNPTITTPITIQAASYSPQDSNYNLHATDAIIQVGNDEYAPTFTYFQLANKIELDDIIEAGDTDFFSTPKIQMDYYNLIKELQHPYSTTKTQKNLSLYTARPISDRHLYENAKQIPVNIFLASTYDFAEGFAKEYGGNRDVWKIRINSQYLTQTFNSPALKHFQTISPTGQPTVPIEKIELINSIKK